MSGFLATADLQAEWGNLDLCTKSWKEAIHICKKHHLKYIVFCGDGKEVYDPVSIRVIKWWQWAIEYAMGLGITVLYLRGNHDRISTFDVGGSWLSILKRAGAITFDKPDVYDDGCQRFFMLPFAKVKTLREWMGKLLKHKPDPKKDILFFHANLIEGRYSQHGQHSDSGLSVDDLAHTRFRFCIGGDIHLPQRIQGNVYYTGSAFCREWGEVNQRKRYLVVGREHIISVHSKLPRWFDPSVNGFEKSKPSSWEGHRVRIKVSCDASGDYGRRLERARAEAEKNYKGADLYIVPSFRDEKTKDSGISTYDSDEHKIKQYILEMASGRRDNGKLIRYMLHKLSKFAGGLRGKSKVEFLEAWGEYILSFKKLHIDFRRSGIHLVRGENLDRQGKSNGSGKTGYMQTIPIALFGQTFKKQKHDHWSNRWYPKRKSVAGIVMRDERGHVVEIERGRRPTLLSLKIDNHNESTGMKTTDRSGTQSQIEAKTGFTWDTLANAVYMDRTVANAFLSGTNKQRTDVLSRFQNLERFEKALKLVKKDSSENEEKYNYISDKYLRISGSIEECAESLKELKRFQKMQLDSAYEEYKNYKSKLKHFKKKHRHKLKMLKRKEQKLEELHSEALEAVGKYEKKYYTSRERWESAKSWAERIAALKKKDKCPTCYQRIDWDGMKRTRNKATDKIEEAYTQLDRFERRLQYARKNVQLTDGSYSAVQEELSRIEREERNCEMAIKTSYKHYNQLRSEQHAAYSVIGKTKDKLKAFKRKKDKLKARKHKLAKRRLMYEFAAEAFSRDGIPAFLNRQLCPVLNRAADYYADLFSDQEIQVRFDVEGGEFVPQVINAKGGEDIDDQSTGERALAGLIASFALREVAPKTNLLMLDEPAEGLDEQTARQFAKGLIKLKDRFKTIFITTHNKAIESALSAEHKVTITKKGGISRVSV